MLQAYNSAGTSVIQPISFQASAPDFTARAFMNLKGCATLKMCLQNSKLPKSYPQLTQIFLPLQHFFLIENTAIKTHINTPNATIVSSARFAISVVTF